MANRTKFLGLDPLEPGVGSRTMTTLPLLAVEPDGIDVAQSDDGSGIARHVWQSADISVPDPESTTPLLPVDKTASRPFEAPRPVTASNDTGAATEDGPAVVLSVLNNDVGVTSVARINGVAVTPGSSITLQSGARVIVNTDGTLSYEVGTAFQSLAAGQTAQDVFTYTAADAGGSPLAPEGVFNASAINGSNGFVINGAAPGDRSGYSVAGIGDVNGDGIDDLLIGALSADPTGRTDAGISYVVYGRQGGFGQSIDLGTLNGTNGFAITGVSAFDYSGASVRKAGDVNGDGLADFLIGAPWGEASQGANAGETYLVFGRQGGFGGSLDLSTLNGANGVTFRGAAAGDGLGFAVSSAGDINGDGFDDLILGAREADGSGRRDAGASYVVFGQAGGFAAGIDVTGLNGTNGFALLGGGSSDRSGYSVSAIGDINGDGIDDLIIGAPMADPSGRANAGEAYVVFGRRGGFDASLDLGTLSGVNGFKISGADAGDHAGWSVASAGDLNGDGIADLVIGALYADPAGRENAGETYVVFGRQGGFGGNLDLSNMPASMGFTINGVAALNLTGHSVASAGDVNGDGIDDLLIGALYADGAGGIDTGETYVVFGRATGFGGVLDLASLNGQTGFAIGGIGAGDFSGHSVSAAGDVNGDGIDDLLIGAPMADPSGRADAGQSYVLFGARNITRLSNEATVTVTITGTNDAPIITSGGGGPSTVIPGVENSTTVTTVVATDPDAGSSLAFSILAGRDGARFAIDAVTGVLTFIAAPDFEAPTDQNGDNVYEVDVQVSDGQGGTDVQTIFVNVSDLPEAPVITSNGGGATGGYTIGENTRGPNAIVAFDPDAGTTLTYSIVGGADAALFAIDAAGVLSLIDAPNFEAPTDQNGDNVYDVIVQVSDGNLTDTQTLSVTVTDVNEAPVITASGGGAVAGYTISENTLGPSLITAVDPDAGAVLTYSIIGGADAARFTISAAGVLSLINLPDFEAPADQNGDNIYEVIVQVSDGELTDTQTINLTVTDANEAPVITSDGGGPTATVFVAEGTRAVTTVVAVDPDAGAQITWSIVGGPDAARFTIDPATGALTFVVPADFEAPTDQNSDNDYDIVVQASDGVNTDTQNLRVTVTDIADTLSLTDVVGSITIHEGGLAARIDGDVTLTDAGIGYEGGTLILTGLHPSDVLFMISTGTGPGQISADFENDTISFEGVVIATVDNAPPTGSEIITFNSLATRAAIEVLLEALTLRSNSDIPVPPHDVTLQITNADGHQTPPVVISVHFVADVLNGSDDGDFLAGYRGNDVISGFGGHDTLLGGEGDDRIFGGTGDDTLSGEDADDVLSGGEDHDYLYGGDGRDVLLGDEGDDFLYGETSDDLLDGGDGDDVLEGGSEDDRLIGGSGADTLRGDDGLDRLEGGDDDDFLYGGSGADILSGGLGIDDLQGDDGDDQLSGDGGNDRIDGGAGIDVAIFKGPMSAYTIQFITVGVVQVTGPDGDDLVLNCEFLQFDDQMVNLEGANNEPPRIVSNGGGGQIGIAIDENQTLVTTILATDANQTTLTYSIVGGADAARFSIDPATGVLTFIAAPDFEAPTDVGRDNTYDVMVAASDGQISDLQGITVTVLNIADAITPSSKYGGGPEICPPAPNDDFIDGAGGVPQVMPGVFDEEKLPPTLDDSGPLFDLFSQQERTAEPLFRNGDANSHEPPPLIAWDDGFA
jgi:VCBS repeat-containing protein